MPRQPLRVPADQPAPATPEAPALQPVLDRYPFAVTDYYAALAERQDDSDPIFRQFMPSPAELEDGPELTADPLAEDGHSPVPGLVHRYPDRCLLLATDACFVHCRHCFRKRNWRRGWRFDEARLAAALDYLRSSPGVREVILSGGDPLALGDDELEMVLRSLRANGRLELIRVHTRALAVQPERITPRLAALLDHCGPVWLNTQFNHVRELTPAAAAAADRLLRAGVPVGNQAVLLKGVNDNLPAQLALHRGLVNLKVRPYYLFHADPAQGAGHFRTTVECGQTLVAGLAHSLSGLAVPVYARELPEGGGKSRWSPA